MPSASKSFLLHDANIIERHAALGQTEVALTKQDGYFFVELITRRADGTFAREPISGAAPRKQSLARRLMDFHAGVVTAQRALGLQIDRRFV